jgi:hypothetical protein
MKLLDVIFKVKVEVINLNVYNHRECRIKVLDLIRSGKEGIFRVIYYSDVIVINSFDRTITSKSLSMVQLINTVLIGLNSDFKVSLSK